MKLVSFKKIRVTFCAEVWTVLKKRRQFYISCDTNKLPFCLYVYFLNNQNRSFRGHGWQGGKVPGQVT